jgi:hypothetical protein
MDRKAGEISNAYDVNVLDALGRNQKQARNKLYQQALLKPENYLEQRNEALEKLIDTMVKQHFELFREFLSKGKMPGGEQLKYPDGKPYFPCVPNASITKFAMKVAETIEDICEKAMEEVYPMEHKDLAIKKLTDINKIKDLE